MHRPRLLAISAFCFLTLTSATAFACTCVPTAGKAFVADIIPEDFTGVGIAYNAAELADGGTLSGTAELQLEDVGGWTTVASATESGLLQPATPWSQGQRYRVVYTGNGGEFVGAERAFDIGAPLGTLKVDLTIDTNTHATPELCFNSCLPPGIEYSEATDVQFELPAALQPYSELVQIEQFVEDQPYRTAYSCEIDGPLPPESVRVAIPCDDASIPGPVDLRYDAVIAGAPNVTIRSASTTVELTCPSCDTGGGDAGPESPDAGPPAADSGAATPMNDGACSAASGSELPTVWLLLLAFVLVRRRV